MVSVDPAPRGWVGETFTIALADGRRCFLKVYDRALPAQALPALRALVELRRLGMHAATLPLALPDGGLHATLGEHVAVLFEFVEGVLTRDFDLVPAAELVATVHRLTPRITAPLAAETFPVEGRLWEALERARSEPADDGVRLRLRRYVEGRWDEFAAEWASLERLAEACRGEAFEPVLTHGDWPWNMLIDARGGYHLVDWDEMLIAPAERDTWFSDDRPEFVERYRALRPGHREHPVFAAYYVHARYFEDLAGVIEEVLGQGTPEHRAAILELLDAPFMQQLRARVRQRAADARR